MRVSFPEPGRAWAALPAPARFPTRAAASLGSTGLGLSNLAVIRQGKSKPCCVASAINVSKRQTRMSSAITWQTHKVDGTGGTTPALPAPRFLSEKRGGMHPERWGAGGRAAGGTPADPAQPRRSPLNRSQLQKTLKSLITIAEGGYQAFNEAGEAPSHPNPTLRHRRGCPRTPVPSWRARSRSPRSCQRRRSLTTLLERQG